MFSKILICADGSACSLSAVRAGAAIARHCGAEVAALTVFQPPVVPEDAEMWPFTITPAHIDDCARDEKEIIALQIAPVLAGLTGPYRLIQKIGDPTDAILSEAEQEKPDLIVIGSRGHRGITELLLGSVSNAVMHHAPCPVLIVRREHISTGSDGFEEIVLASDGSRTAEKAAQAAIEIAQKFATSLTVLTVSTDLSASLLPREEAALHEEEALFGSQVTGLDASRTLEQIRTAVSPLAKRVGVYCCYVQKYGEPHDTIVHYARTNCSDLIVIGSRGLGAVGEVLFGSVSNYVAHHATCPVLVVR